MDKNRQKIMELQQQIDSMLFRLRKARGQPSAPQPNLQNAANSVSPRKPIVTIKPTVGWFPAAHAKPSNQAARPSVKLPRHQIANPRSTRYPPD